MKSKVSANSVPANALPSDTGKHITRFEYVCLMLARIGGMFGTTLTGTLAAAFLHELYFGPVGVDSDEIASIMAVQTTLTTVLGIVIGLISSVIIQKWKSRWGRYRHWYVICALPVFAMTVLYFYVPQGWTIQQMTMLRYGIACCQTVFNAFNNAGQNVAQVISPNPKEKKTVATIWQLSYYLGYGAAYLGTFVYGLFSDDKNSMYMTLALVAAIVTAFGNLMCGFFCKERIELPKKDKVKISKELFTLFKYKNYRAYQYMQWVNNFAAIGKFTTYLVAITVGSSKNLLLTIPTAVGTVVGNLITTKLSKKYEPTQLLKFSGPYALISASVLFGICFIEAKMGLMFFSGWNSIFFYVFYFLFGVGIGIQELSNSHFNVEYYDYLEWQTGDRMEAIQGIVPGWINSAINYLKELMIPFMIAWVGYKSSAEGDLVATMQAEPTYMKTCLWLLAFVLFGYAISNTLKAIILKFLYDIEGEKKEQMYRELEKMREERHAENEAISK
ncbi:MAG: MFS transporter [Clostridia bacterium]|nr:MFS transporter [Clostridia bacterium]MBQ4338707.1 MFS transporter [Clostridia bacterium]